MRTDNWGELLIAGVVGSFVGGLLASLIAGDGLALRPSGIIGSVIGAVLVLAGARWWSSRAARRPRLSAAARPPAARRSPASSTTGSGSTSARRSATSPRRSALLEAMMRGELAPPHGLAHRRRLARPRDRDRPRDALDRRRAQRDPRRRARQHRLGRLRDRGQPRALHRRARGARDRAPTATKCSVPVGLGPQPGPLGGLRTRPSRLPRVYHRPTSHGSTGRPELRAAARHLGLSHAGSGRAAASCCG